MALRDEIQRIMDEPTKDDPAVLRAEVFGDPSEVQKLSLTEGARLSLRLVHGVREAMLVLADEVEALRPGS